MANGHPKFGGTNGVSALDIGQVGGTRQTAGNAKFTGHVYVGEDEVATVQTGLPQQQAVFQDVLGYRGTTVRWEGIIRADGEATMMAIIRELNQHKTGSLRNETTGVMQAPNPKQVRATQLTHSLGRTLSQAAVMTDWRQVGQMMKSSEWALMMEVSITFRMLG